MKSATVNDAETLQMCASNRQSEHHGQ